MAKATLMKTHLSRCDKLEILEREHNMLYQKAYSYALDPITNEYPPESLGAFAKIRGNEKAQRALLRMMDEERMNEPEGTRT